MFLPASNKPSGVWMMILVLIISSIAVLTIYPASAQTGITITAQGDRSYYLGEEIVFSGYNYDSDSTFLFITGPAISPSGGKLSSPHQNATMGIPGSFETVKTKPDKTWEYTLYSYNLGIHPGPYTVYAASQPGTKDQLTSETSGNASIIFKQPFITAEISPSSTPKGQPLFITGYAEGNPREVQIWIIGNNFLLNTTNPVDPDSTYHFTIDPKISEKIPKGQCYLIVQHPMQNNQLDIIVSGNFIRNQQLNNGTNLFNAVGPGSLQGNDVKEALIFALNDPSVDDTYTEIPLMVDDTGISTPQGPPATTTPVQQQTQKAPIQYAPVGAIVLVWGIVVWSRRLFE
jgi:hypothetical protein